jgi:hypothetical protein
MKKLTTDLGSFGPYESVAVKNDYYEVNGGAVLPFAVYGLNGVVSEWDEPMPSNGNVDEAAAAVRAERNAKLAETDWTQLVDSPVDHAAWFEYRQALRDIPSQAGFPWTVEWPTQP